MNSDQTKTVADFLIADFESEMQATLRLIEAVPGGRLEYRPDSKSKTALGLVRHIALEDESLFPLAAEILSKKDKLIIAKEMAQRRA